VCYFYWCLVWCEKEKSEISDTRTHPFTFLVSAIHHHHATFAGSSTLLL
jgi:hypothetical protein